MVLRILIGNPPVMKIMKQCPQPSARAFFCANSMSSGSFQVRRSRAGPLDSQNAMPNFIWGTVCTIASCRSSIVLMKCDWPRMKLTSVGLSIGTVVSSMAAPLHCDRGPRVWYDSLPSVRRRRADNGPQLDPLLGLHIRISAIHSALDIKSTAHSVHD